MIDTEEKPRSIRFPRNLWDAIDQDAKRAKRSAVKQMEVVLSIYYGLQENEVNTERLSKMRSGNLDLGIALGGDLKPKAGKLPLPNNLGFIGTEDEAAKSDLAKMSKTIKSSKKKEK